MPCLVRCALGLGSGRCGGHDAGSAHARRRSAPSMANAESSIAGANSKTSRNTAVTSTTTAEEAAAGPVTGGGSCSRVLTPASAAADKAPTVAAAMLAPWCPAAPAPLERRRGVAVAARASAAHQRRRGVVCWRGGIAPPVPRASRSTTAPIGVKSTALSTGVGWIPGVPGAITGGGPTGGRSS